MSADAQTDLVREVGALPPSPPADSAFDSVHLLGVRFHCVDEVQCIEHVVRRCTAGHGGWLVTPNLEILRQAATDPEIGGLVQQADLSVADGMPLIWASRLQGAPLPGRVCGSNLISSLPARAAAAGLSIYLLGGAGDVARRAARILQERHPSLRIAGTDSPALGFERDPDQIARMARAIEETRPDLVFFALPFPKGERLVQQIRSARPDAWWIGVGVSLSFLCGDVRRAPRWMQRLGVEWLHRLLQEPSRLLRRYLLLGVPFALQLFSGALSTRLREAPASGLEMPRILRASLERRRVAAAHRAPRRARRRERQRTIASPATPRRRTRGQPPRQVGDRKSC